MFLMDMMILAVSWGLLQASERVIPKLHTSLSLSNDWATFLFFKPLHLLLSLLCFVTAILMIRMVTKKNIKMLFSKGKYSQVNRIESLALISLSIWLTVIVIFKYLWPASIFIGILITFDFFNSLAIRRRNKRLKMAFRQFQ